MKVDKKKNMWGKIEKLFLFARKFFNHHLLRES